MAARRWWARRIETCNKPEGLRLHVTLLKEGFSGRAFYVCEGIIASELWRAETHVFVLTAQSKRAISSGMLHSTSGAWGKIDEHENYLQRGTMILTPKTDPRTYASTQRRNARERAPRLDSLAQHLLRPGRRRRLGHDVLHRPFLGRVEDLDEVMARGLERGARLVLALRRVLRRRRQDLVQAHAQHVVHQLRDQALEERAAPRLQTGIRVDLDEVQPQVGVEHEVEAQELEARRALLGI